jgi:two-component system cell cycle sensor histidine kinase PleC
VAPQAERAAVALAVDDGLEPLPVVADAKMLRQILMNLLSNAIKFNRPGGWVKLSLLRLGDGGVELALSDSGIGVDPALIPELFEPFRRADSKIARSYGGTGLGLAIVRKLAHLHDGDVAMESEPGVGTTVRLRLPRERIAS